MPVDFRSQTSVKHWIQRLPALACVLALYGGAQLARTAGVHRSSRKRGTQGRGD